MHTPRMCELLKGTNVGASTTLPFLGRSQFCLPRGIASTKVEVQRLLTLRNAQ